MGPKGKSRQPLVMGRISRTRYRLICDYQLEHSPMALKMVLWGAHVQWAMVVRWLVLFIAVSLHTCFLGDRTLAQGSNNSGLTVHLPVLVRTAQGHPVPG